MAFSSKMKAPPFGKAPKEKEDAPAEEMAEGEDEFDSLFGDSEEEGDMDPSSITLADATVEQLQAELDKRMEEEGEDEAEEEDDMEESDSEYLV